MAQARSLQSALQAQGPRRERARNLRTILVLVGTVLALFVGSILYILWYPAVQ